MHWNGYGFPFLSAWRFLLPLSRLTVETVCVCVFSFFFSASYCGVYLHCYYFMSCQKYWQWNLWISSMVDGVQVSAWLQRNIIISHIYGGYGAYGISGIQSTTDYQHCRQFASGEIGCHHSAHKYSKWNAFDFCLLRHLSLSLGVVVFFLCGICGRRLHFKWL